MKKLRVEYIYGREGWNTVKLLMWKADDTLFFWYNAKVLHTKCNWREVNKIRLFLNSAHSCLIWCPFSASWPSQFLLTNEVIWANKMLAKFYLVMKKFILLFFMKILFHIWYIFFCGLLRTSSITLFKVSDKTVCFL